jgi:hypothetical protein
MGGNGTCLCVEPFSGAACSNGTCPPGQFRTYDTAREW